MTSRLASRSKATQRKAGLQRKQGHVWQVFSSPRNSKIQNLASKVQIVEAGLENVPAHGIARFRI